MTLIFDQLAEEFARQAGTTLVLTDFTTTRFEQEPVTGLVREITETAVSLTWKEDDTPWSNFIVTKKKRQVASVMETFSGVASVPGSPLQRQSITLETNPPETSMSSLQQRSEIVWTGKTSLPRSVLLGWLDPLSQDPSLSILGTTLDGTVKFPELSLSSMSKELSDPEDGLEILLECLSQIIGSYFQQRPEILGLTISPCSSPTDSIVIVPSSNKNTWSTSPTSSFPRLEDIETSEDSSDSEDKS